MRCGEKCEVFSRVVGYHRPVSNWNKGKQEEFKDRLAFEEDVSVKSPCCNHVQEVIIKE